MAYQNSWPKAVDITANVVADDASFRAKKQAGGSGKWEMIPKAILIVTAADSVEDIVLRTFGNDQTITMKLKSNVIHNIAIDQVVKTGTTIQQIIILGD